MKNPMLIIIFILILIASCNQKNKALNTYFPNLNWNSSLKNKIVFVDKEFRYENKTDFKFNFEKDSKHEYLITENFKNIEQDLAEKILKNKLLMIKEIYATQATPYNGAVTNETNCVENPAINPLIEETINHSSILLELKATERLVLGVCSDKQNIFKVQVLLMYCKKTKELYDLKYYSISNEKMKLPIASCL